VREQKKRTENRNRQAHHHPKRKAEIEEQPEREEHEHQPLNTVLLQHLQPVDDKRGCILGDEQFHLWVSLLLVDDELLDDLGDFDCVLVLGLFNLQDACAALAEEYLVFGSFKNVSYRGDVTQPDFAAFGAGDDDQLFQLQRRAAFLHKPDEDVLLFGFKNPGGQVDALPLDDAGNVGGTEIETLERCRREFDT